MGQIKLNVSSGICGMQTVIIAECDDMQNVHLTVNSGCGQIMELAKQIKDVDAFIELFSGFGEGQAYKAAKATIKHAACPVPAAIIKAVEASAGMALKKDVHITFD